MKFEIYKTKRREHGFRFVADNGEPLLASEGYKNRKDCLATVQLIVDNAYYANVVDADTGKTIYNAEASVEQIEQKIMESGLDG